MERECKTNTSQTRLVGSPTRRSHLSDCVEQYLCPNSSWEVGARNEGDVLRGRPGDSMAFIERRREEGPTPMAIGSQEGGEYSTATPTTGIGGGQPTPMRRETSTGIIQTTPQLQDYWCPEMAQVHPSWGRTMHVAGPPPPPPRFGNSFRGREDPPPPEKPGNGQDVVHWPALPMRRGGGHSQDWCPNKEWTPDAQRNGKMLGQDQPLCPYCGGITQKPRIKGWVIWNDTKRQCWVLGAWKRQRAPRRPP